jgi:queuosine precursor transporter
MNFLIFIMHTCMVSSAAVCALAWGQHALVAFICLQAILANTFVIKSITLLGFTATAADPYAIGAVIGLQLLQEFYGRPAAQHAITISFGLLGLYTLLSMVHLCYIPAATDVTQSHFFAIFSATPRLIGASLLSYWATCRFDSYLLARLKAHTNNTHFTIRNWISASLSQLFDTVCFSVLGLYGIVSPLWQIISVSYALKMIALGLCTPSLMLIKNVLQAHPIKDN